MSKSKNLLKFAAIFGAATLTLGLTSCAGGQSEAEACEIALSSLEKTSAGMESLQSDAMQEGFDFEAAFGPVSKALKTAQADITNEKVSGSLETVAADFEGIFEIARGLDLAALNKIDPTDTAAMEEAMKLTTELTEKSTALQESSTKLGELCAI